MVIAVTVIFCLLISEVSASVTLELPTAANCGDNASLICRTTGGSLSSRTWKSSRGDIMINGAVVDQNNYNKYSETFGSSSVTLTIHQTSLSDMLQYSCAIGYDESTLQPLKFECKATSALPEVNNGKRLKLTVGNLYPNNPQFQVSQNISGPMTGSVSCSISGTQGYVRCVWTSNLSLADGYYSYSLIVTTITQASPLNGAFRVVTPRAPEIANVTSDSKERLVIYGVQDESFTIQCASKGGNPAPAVALYKSNMTDSGRLVISNSTRLENDNTYTVTVNYTLIPSVSDDKAIYYCRSYYPGADTAYQGSANTSAILFLTLKPSKPEIKVNSVSAGQNVEVKCSTMNSRPEPSIHFVYKGQVYRSAVNHSQNPVSETFTSESILQLLVDAEDNGQNVECIVEHLGLKNPPSLSSFQRLNVFFPVALSSTNITGNKVTVVNGNTSLGLRCKTGSSNPASNITWTHGEKILQSNSLLDEERGENNGAITSQLLVLYPTRSMDGDTITCSVSNVKFPFIPAVNYSVTLDLHYSPLINTLTNVTVVEGDSAKLICTAVSKPPSRFKWSKLDEILTYGNGTVDSNKLEFTLSHANRNNASSYICIADNGIEPPDVKILVVTVHYPPDVTIQYTNTSVKDSNVTLTCVARGIPSSNYTYGKWFRNWPGRSKNTIQTSGQMLHLMNLTYEDSGEYTCSASNNVEKFGTGQYFMEGSVFLLVKCRGRPQVHRGIQVEPPTYCKPSGTLPHMKIRMTLPGFAPTR